MSTPRKTDPGASPTADRPSAAAPTPTPPAPAAGVPGDGAPPAAEQGGREAAADAPPPATAPPTPQPPARGSSAAAEAPADNPGADADAAAAARPAEAGTAGPGGGRSGAGKAGSGAGGAKARPAKAGAAGAVGRAGAAEVGAGKVGAAEAGAGKAGAGKAAVAKAGAGKPGAGKAGTARVGAGKPGAGKAGAGTAGAGTAGAGKGGVGRGAGGKGAVSARGGKGGAGRGAPVGPELVVGTVPPVARVAGGIAVLAALLLLIAPGFPLAQAGGRDLGGPGNGWAFVPALPLVALVAAAGVLALRGILPRLALAVLLPVGTIAAGLLLRTLHLMRSGSRSTLDLPLGIGESTRYQAGAGLALHAGAYALLLAAALLAAAAWPRTIMEDGGDLDPRRPRLAAWGLAVGVLTALFLGMAPYSSSIAPGAPTLPEREGLDLLGALVVALGAAAWAVLAATLRPRLGVVGGYAGLAAVLLTQGLSIALLVARSDALGVSAGGVGVLLAAVAAALLALVATRVGRLRVGR